MIIIASDGGARKQTATSSVGGWAIAATDGFTLSGTEHNSTNQRAELLGCIAALDYAGILQSRGEDVALLFDSSYVADGLLNKWVNVWHSRKWKTSTGEAVKNKDLWMRIKDQWDCICEDELMIYRIKSHITLKGPKSMEKGRASFIKNNGGLPPEEVFIEMIKLNNEADRLASEAIEDTLLYCN